jgi:hypothetical protein
MTRFIALSLALCAATACSSSGSSASQTASAPVTRDTTAAGASTRGSRNVLTEADLMKSTARDALQAIQILRPDWLRSRGSAASISGGVAEVVVYLNGQRFGGPEALSQFQPTALKEARYMSASEATNRFGTGHNSGAILIRTK